ncbi:MAG: calcium/sodium antiporter [Alphaproteobacteria bacterium]|jgi:cation:H+ antiporter|nr:calcium/sodium antiporter [Alphaproteobacteria bacterium]
MTDLLMVFGGLALLFVGGEALIKGAVALARNYGLSSLLVSAVVVGFGTSMPELTVSVGAALRGSSDISVGNVLGSNIANILLIIGVASIMTPLLIERKAVRRDALVALGSSLILCALALFGQIGFISGLILFLMVVAYISWSYVQDSKNGQETIQHIEEDIEGKPELGRLKAALYSLAGLVLLMGGAHVLVEGAVSIARSFNISEAVIGLTIVAVGTSLPELVTAIVAAYRRHNDVIIGNILGSNIFNILSILGITAMITPIQISDKIAAYDIWIMLGVTLLFSIYLLRGWAIRRASGIVMLAAYTAYTAWLYCGR